MVLNGASVKTCEFCDHMEWPAHFAVISMRCRPDSEVCSKADYRYRPSYLSSQLTNMLQSLVLSDF